jgi:hypothetical protein
MPNRSLPVRYLISIACALALLSSSARAQVADESNPYRPGFSSTEIWGGYSPGSTSAGVLGRHRDIALGLLGMRWNRRIRASDTGFVYYTFEVIPLARVTPLVVYNAAAPAVCDPPNFDCIRSSAAANGIGFSPLGFTIITRSDQAVQWRFGMTGGALIFDRPTPSDLASRFNFTAAIEAGVQVVNRNGAGVLIVYRLHHLSNASLSEDNLAMLSHVFSIGGRWRVSR